MTTEEFISVGNTLQSLVFRLWNSENMNMWFTYRNEKDRGHFMDISLFVGNNGKPKKCIYIYQIDSLNEAKKKMGEIYKFIQRFE